MAAAKDGADGDAGSRRRQGRGGPFPYDVVVDMEALIHGGRQVVVYSARSEAVVGADLQRQSQTDHGKNHPSDDQGVTSRHHILLRLLRHPVGGRILQIFTPSGAASPVGTAALGYCWKGGPRM